MKTNPWSWSTGPIEACQDPLVRLMCDFFEVLAMKRRSPQAQDLRTPKYRKRVVPNKKRALSKRACRNPQR